MKIAQWGLVILLASPAGATVAQSQQDQAPAPQQQPSAQGQSDSGQKPDALADAARHAREEKKDPAKAAKVWDNDSMPAVGGTINVVGQAAPPTPDDTAANQANGQAQNGQAQGAAGNAGAAQGNKSASALTADLNSAKAELESAQKDLDLLQRKFALDQQTFLSNPGHDSDRESAAGLKNQQDSITAKQQDVAAAQKKVDDLQQKLTAAGGPTKQ
jgi:hypothetical protein